MEDELGSFRSISPALNGRFRRRQIGDTRLQLAAGAGFGTTITNEGLDPVDLLDPHFAGRHISLSGGLPTANFVVPARFGLLVSRCVMPVVRIPRRRCLCRPC